MLVINKHALKTMEKNLSKTSFYTNLSKITKLTPFVDFDSLTYDDIFNEFICTDDCELVYTDSLVVWESRIPVLSDCYKPKPSSPLIKALLDFEGYSLLISDVNLPMKESFFLCTLCDQNDMENLIDLKFLNKDTKLIISSFKQNFLIAGTLTTFLKFNT